MTDRITELLHHPYAPPEGFEAVPPAVHKASTVVFKDVASMRARRWRDKTGYTYGLHGTPTTFTLEARLATLEGGTHTLLAPSGLAAITLVNLALLKSGDEVLIPTNAYAPSREQARTLLARCGVSHRLYDPMDAAAFAEMLSSKTRLVWLEAPGSVTMEFPDLPALVRAARTTKAVCALDNTWGAGVAFDPFDLGGGLGVDLSMHALTKYASGGADVLMGSITTKGGALHDAIADAHMATGVGVAANDAELMLRSLPTLALRYREHDRIAREVAAWLATRPEVKQVLHPAMPRSPGHENWQALCKDAAGLFSVVLDPSIPAERVDAFVDALRLFRIGYSWGGPVSLVLPYDLRALRGASEPTAVSQGMLVRFAIGFETSADLIADIEQALSCVHGGHAI